MKKIAFCFLIYDTINHEELWNLFFQHVDKNKYAIYIHYKYNNPLTYFESYKLSNCIETKYADVSLTHAHNLLFKQAYDDGCDKMINVSQSCIPFKNFDYIYDFLTKDDFSHFNIMPQSQCFPRCNSLLKYYDISTIQKSSEWFILNRNICKKVIDENIDKINKEYNFMWAPEEIYFIMQVFKYQLQNEIVTPPNPANDATTFTNWEGMDYTYPSTSGLKNYSSITDEELYYLMNSKCLFGRKFNKECILNNKMYINWISSL
jgi:hypothetical protein